MHQSFAQRVITSIKTVYHNLHVDSHWIIHEYADSTAIKALSTGGGMEIVEINVSYNQKGILDAKKRSEVLMVDL